MTLRNRRSWRSSQGIVLGLCALLWATRSVAAGNVEAGAFAYQLTQGYGTWQGLYARGVWGEGSSTVGNWELDHGREFGQTETYGVAGLTETWSPRWYSNLSLGASTATTVVPRARIDVSLSYKALASKEWVSTLGFTGISYRDGQSDRSGWLDLALYLPDDFLLSGGHTWTTSVVGSVGAQRSFVALTYGRVHHFYLTARYGFGREAYVPIGVHAALVNFGSRSASLTWRAWVTKRFGTNVYFDDFRSRYYQQYGGSFGVFYDF